MNPRNFPAGNVLCCVAFLDTQGWKEGFSLLAEMRFVVLAGGLKNRSQLRSVHSYQLPQAAEEMVGAGFPAWSWEWVWPGCYPLRSTGL